MVSVVLSRLMRDLRSRKYQVIVSAFILGLGCGAWFGVGCCLEWRRHNMDSFYDKNHLHSGVLTFHQETGVDTQELIQLVNALPTANKIQAFDLRLRMRIALEFNNSDGFSVVEGYLYGHESFANVGIDQLALRSGRLLEPGDVGDQLIMLDDRFSRDNDQPHNESILLRTAQGNKEPMVVGTVTSAEWLFPIDPESSSFSTSSSFTIAFTLLSTLQSWAQLGDRVNELTFLAQDSEDPEALGSELLGALVQQGHSVSLRMREDGSTFKMLDEDLKSDKETFMGFVLIVLGVAIFTIWITMSRLIVSQRREIGVDLSLGVRQSRILAYYLCYGLSIGVLSLVFAVVSGLWVANTMWSLTETMMHFPVVERPFQMQSLTNSWMLGVLSVVLASVWPALNAARMTPAKALRQDPSVSSTPASVSRFLGWCLWPLVALSLSAKLALRNVIRGRRRTLGTLFGIALSISLPVLMMSTFHSIDVTFDQYRAEQGDWDVRACLHQPTAMLAFENMTNDPRVSAVDFGIAYFAEIETIESDSQVVELKSYSNDDMLPTELVGIVVEQEDAPVLVISEGMADEEGLKKSDTTKLAHPVFGGPFGCFRGSSTVSILAFHQRASKLDTFLPWIQIQWLLNVSQAANFVFFTLTPGQDADTFGDALYDNPIVKLVETRIELSGDVQDMVRDFGETFNSFKILFYAMALGVVVVTSMITLAERRRELGTMLTLGASRRQIVGVHMWEISLISIPSTVLGAFFGWLFMTKVMLPNMAETFGAFALSGGISVRSWFDTSVIICGLSLAAQLLTYLSISKMDLSQATKVRD